MWHPKHGASKRVASRSRRSRIGALCSAGFVERVLQTESPCPSGSYLDRNNFHSQLWINPAGPGIVRFLQKAQYLPSEGGEFSKVICAHISSCRELADTPCMPALVELLKGLTGHILRETALCKELFHEFCLPSSGLLWLCGAPVATPWALQWICGSLGGSPSAPL